MFWTENKRKHCWHCSGCGYSCKNPAELSDGPKVCPKCGAEIVLWCSDCKKTPYYPDNRCCFKCEEDMSECNVGHICGQNCPEWKGRNEIGIMKLENTVDLMLSKDYKERFQAEYYQVKIRYERLKAMLRDWDEGRLEFAPTCLKPMYSLQIASMRSYLDVLEERAKLEDIDL